MALSFLSPKLYEIQFSPLKSGSHNPFLGGLWGGCRDCDEHIVSAASGGRSVVRGNSRTDPGATTPGLFLRAAIRGAAHRTGLHPEGSTEGMNRQNRAPCPQSWCWSSRNVDRVAAFDRSQTVAGKQLCPSGCSKGPTAPQGSTSHTALLSKEERGQRCAE